MRLLTCHESTSISWIFLRWRREWNLDAVIMGLAKSQVNEPAEISGSVRQCPPR